TADRPGLLNGLPGRAGKSGLDATAATATRAHAVRAWPTGVRGVAGCRAGCVVDRGLRRIAGAWRRCAAGSNRRFRRVAGGPAFAGPGREQFRLPAPRGPQSVAQMDIAGCRDLPRGRARDSAAARPDGIGAAEPAND